MTEISKNWHKKLPPTLNAYAGANTFNSSCFKGSTIILRMGAWFGFPEQSDVPSIVTMVSSRRWPLISSYGASGRTQPLKLKMIDSFFKISFYKVDDGNHEEALLDFYTSSGKRKPDQIIISRDQAGFSADDLQEFVHALSYMYQRSITVIFVVPPICYAHLAASQLGAIYED
ncbi:hypothetical protein CXB51_003769 [Gossypium anomalum]|uniref:Piwi domain-containing protein n=1 Tax=Gossypium anomalum TaxID=47600 RepID=A0A8J5ZJ12_9ROSI|nr:hypothetical protein CXB51_003769 [Gossypium anomalum]